jgi:hypothetical protein
MSFDARYQLLELIGDEGAKTFVSQEISTGKRVTVFLFVEEQARAQSDFLVQLRAVDRSQFPELIETGDNRGTPYAVTEPVGSLKELKSRLSHVKGTPPEGHKTEDFTKAGMWHVPFQPSQSKGGATHVPEEPIAANLHETEKTSAHRTPSSFSQMFQAPAAPIDEPVLEAPKAPASIVAPTPPKPAPGSFTQMFQAPAAPIDEPVPEPPKAPASIVAPTPPKPAPGSFTQMFQTPAAPIDEPVPEPPKAPASIVAPTPPKPAPGSFTQMFQAPAPPIGEPGPRASKAPPLPVPGKPAQSGPGEFTRFFNAASSSSSAPSPVPQKPESQGDFARIFGGGESVTAPPATITGVFGQSPSAAAPKSGPSARVPAPPPSFTQPAGEFTKIFGDTAMEIPTMGPIAAPTPSLSAAPPNPASGPGEYTRMFGVQAIAQESLAEPAQAPIVTPEAPAPIKHPSKMIPVLIGIILLLLAAIAVIVVTMKT